MIQDGDKFGYLTTHKKIKENGRTFFECKCICGKMVIRRDDSLRTVRSLGCVTSCGCKHPMKQTGDKSSTWKGHGKISGQYLANIRCRCKRKNLPIDIDAKFIWELYNKQNGLCALTKLPICLKLSKRTSDPDQTASLDRIDSKKGYTKDNCIGYIMT